MRAKKVLIDLILASHHAQKHGLSQAVLMNYNFSLDQLKQIQDGDLSNLASSKNPDDIKDMPYPLIDTKEQVRLKDTHVITESEQKEMLDKQVRAVRKLKEDFGLQDIGTFTKRRQEQTKLRREEDLFLAPKGLTVVESTAQVASQVLQFAQHVVARSGHNSPCFCFCFPWI